MRNQAKEALGEGEHPSNYEDCIEKPTAGELSLMKKALKDGSRRLSTVVFTFL